MFLRIYMWCMILISFIEPIIYLILSSIKNSPMIDIWSHIVFYSFILIIHHIQLFLLEDEIEVLKKTNKKGEK